MATKSPQTTKSKASKPSKSYHMPKSPKSQVHKTFDEKGKKAAEALGSKLEVAQGRLNRWLREWSEARA